MRRKIVIQIMAFALGLFILTLSSNAKNGSADVVSKEVDPAEQKFEWTLERMLMATPMPMTKEERHFFSSHPTLDGIRTWKPDEFRKYISAPLGRRHAAEEAVRWRDLVEMLTKQVAAVRPVLGKQQEARGARPLATEFDGKTVADMETALSAPSLERVYVQMKIWRQEIADQASQVEALRKEAQSQGLGDKFESALSEVE